MNVDWKLLREQKEYLVTLTDTIDPMGLTGEVEVLDGIIHFIDAFQDWSVDQGNATEAEVFGELT